VSGQIKLFSREKSEIESIPNLHLLNFGCLVLLTQRELAAKTQKLA
jgi:hypothetical protein